MDKNSYAERAIAFFGMAYYSCDTGPFVETRPFLDFVCCALKSLSMDIEK
jgi:hypothetical protein